MHASALGVNSKQPPRFQGRVVPCTSQSLRIYSTNQQNPEASLPDVPEKEEVGKVLEFWFGTTDLSLDSLSSNVIPRWFTKDTDFDRACELSFEPLIARAAQGEFAAWEEHPVSSLALVILLDQFSRNIYRNTPQSFAQDAQALRIAKKAVARGFDQSVGCLQRSFFYMPFEHSEDLADQTRACQLFLKLTEAASPSLREHCQGFHKFALKHREVISRFGRFPHRNEILRRESTAEEAEFLRQPGSRF